MKPIILLNLSDLRVENGILFSEIAPKSQVLTCIGDHFANRFPLKTS